MAAKVCLAVDLGAGSGRVMAGFYDGNRLDIRELSRFPSQGCKTATGWRWDFEQIWRHIKVGIAVAVREYGSQVVSLGVDSWGVDYGLLDANGGLLSQPFQYRDARTDGMMEEAFRHMPREEIYRRTGVQFMFFNTLFQLLAEKRGAGMLERAEHLLFIPDLVNYRLTGRKVIERSIASTGQLLDATTRQWDWSLLAAMELPEKIFGELVEAGTDLGPMLASVQQEVGASRLRVIAPGCHDTASAVAGLPANDDEPVFLSSGTWSLIGRELRATVLTEESFSNEGGVFGTTRLLKNIAGMWLLQECKRAWDAAGKVYSYEELVGLAKQEPPFLAVIDPDADDFISPQDMPQAIVRYCQRTGQSAPLTAGQFTRVILESLALKYRLMKDKLAVITGKPITRIHIIGGGSQNALLNQFAADATDCEIVAGPVEATSIGNILVQLIALGELPSLAAGRLLVKKSFATEIFRPQNTVGWEKLGKKI